jgi:hypothetical protein
MALPPRSVVFALTASLLLWTGACVGAGAAPAPADPADPSEPDTCCCSYVADSGEAAYADRDADDCAEVGGECVQDVSCGE